MVSKKSRTSYRSILVSGLLVTILASILFAITRHGTEVHAASEAQWALILERESQAFCRKFGFATEESKIAECAADLLSMMRRHEERVIKKAAGIL